MSENKPKYRGGFIILLVNKSKNLTVYSACSSSKWRDSKIWWQFGSGCNFIKILQFKNLQKIYIYCWKIVFQGNGYGVYSGYATGSSYVSSGTGYYSSGYNYYSGINRVYFSEYLESRILLCIPRHKEIEFLGWCLKGYGYGGYSGYATGSSYYSSGTGYYTSGYNYYSGMSLYS